ncbi:MAG: V-type ATP synthase subunit D, partial [Oscillospiraceae bacterium]|nr:V-type ATP synthase subunit D [Oscillospiraceae bacterium]
ETAVRGHKLLKDKQDELVRRFVVLARQTKQARARIEAADGIEAAYKDFALAGALQPAEFAKEALMIPAEKISLEITTQNIMGVAVPKLELAREAQDAQSEGASLFPYGFFGTSEGTDRAIQKMFDILPELIKLGELEKTCGLMADEIEKTRRRVNALEYMTIPQLTETIQYIRMKLDENERSNFVRLMKVKSMKSET